MQNRRGGRVKLMSILLPETEFNHKEKVCGGTFICDITRFDQTLVLLQVTLGHPLSDQLTSPYFVEDP